jgi:hypothetical protein
MDKNFIQNSIYKRDTSNSVDYLYSYCIVEVQNVESRLKSLDNQKAYSDRNDRIGCVGRRRCHPRDWSPKWSTSNDYFFKYFITILNDLVILTYFISVFFLFDLFKVIGGMIVDKLEEMVVAARDRVVILVNPSLADRPSSNNMMQIRGRAESCRLFSRILRVTSVVSILRRIYVSYLSEFFLLFYFNIFYFYDCSIPSGTVIAWKKSNDLYK